MKISELPINRHAPCRGCFRSAGKNPSEFEVQAFLYHELKLMGYFVRGEVCVHGQRARFDLVIYGQPESDGFRWPIRIVEVKRGGGSCRSSTKSGKQIGFYYERFGIPVDFVGGLKEAKSYLEKIRSVLPIDAICRGSKQACEMR